MRMSYLMVAALALLAFDASAQKACETNYVQEGSFFAGRKFTTWEVVPVAPAQAFKRIKIEGVKAGLTLKTSDEESGLLVFEQNAQGSKGQVTLPWNVLIEPEGKTSSKITVTKLTPGGFNTSEKFQRESTCGVIEAASTK